MSATSPAPRSPLTTQRPPAGSPVASTGSSSISAMTITTTSSTRRNAFASPCQCSDQLGPALLAGASGNPGRINGPRPLPPKEGTRQQSRKREHAMTETSLDQLGPVDYIVVEFPAGESNFTGEMAKELLALVDSETVRVIDALILTKGTDGSVDAMELSDLDDLGPLQKIETEL